MRVKAQTTEGHEIQSTWRKGYILWRNDAIFYLYTTIIEDSWVKETRRFVKFLTP